MKPTFTRMSAVQPPLPARRWPLWCVVGIWALVTAAGFTAIWAYGHTPGAAGRDTEDWPAASAVAPASDRPTLVMFLHPKCPCSRASLEELSRVLALYPDAFALRFVFFQPDRAEESWTQTDLWKKARSLPHAEVVTDKSAAEAKLFGALTSGDTYIYDPSGTLKFHGGLTASRGHAGDSPGQDAIRQIAQSQVPSLTRFAVFGCPIIKDTP